MWGKLQIPDSLDDLDLSFEFIPIERLERLGIVKKSGDAKRDRVYCAKALLDLLEEPARLTPAGI